MGLRNTVIEEGEGKSGWEPRMALTHVSMKAALYCANQVRYLPGLRKRYRKRLDEARREAARLRTEERVQDAKEERELTSVRD